MRRTMLSALAMALPLGAAVAADRTGGLFNRLSGNLGAKGYDVVAYQTLGKPTPGDAQFQQAHGGVTWRFANAEHLTLFRADPARYLPQHGGFCSWAVARGYLADIDPVHGWKVVDGKPYLNYSASIQRTWEKDIPGFIAKAEANWPKLNR
ncbi:MAG TPA: YHS domain-containing (seleno)protein [Vineibacter sp.]|nr:YHS domain-containing (seleno)protein [Vineibacter sp.]